MAKQRKTVEQVLEQKSVPEPKLTHTGFQITFWVGIVGLIAQFVMAFMVFPTLPKMIPSWWIGQLVQAPTVPAWSVFALFPIGQIVVLGVAYFSPRDKDGKIVLESGKAWTLAILALLFTVLQASAFHLPKA